MDPAKYEVLKQAIQREFSQYPEVPNVLMPEDTALVKSIRTETAKWNRNNKTRTEAYWAFYNKHPEIHWAFLAHMVSRNGGYHMTDLKGSTMDHLINEGDQLKYFYFLERANSAIFMDAYPQLLLYEYSKRLKISLRKFLRSFHVSRFMYPIWEFFEREQNSILLTVAMIINEQKMLEERIIKHSRHAEIFQRIDFQLQEFFGFTTVIFPYKQKPGGMYSLTGLTVTRFADPYMRIMTGKILYSLLFQKQTIFQGINDFAKKMPHTGSRADYWKAIYTNEKTIGGSEAIYSPVLHDAWPDKSIFPVPYSDWFTKESDINNLETFPVVERADITQKIMKNVRHIKVINDLKSIV
jgi:hypothetical protein